MLAVPLRISLAVVVCAVVSHEVSSGAVLVGFVSNCTANMLVFTAVAIFCSYSVTCAPVANGRLSAIHSSSGNLVPEDGAVTGSNTDPVVSGPVKYTVLALVKVVHVGVPSVPELYLHNTVGSAMC